MLTIFRKLHHVCIVVQDIHKAVAYYESVGIGPWHPYDASEYTELDLQNPLAWGETQYMYTDLDNVQIQLCQPGTHPDPKRTFLETHGEGVFHLGFLVENCDAGEAAGKHAGLTVLERGRRDDRSGFTYFDTAAHAGVVLEIRSNKAPAQETS
ncbi:MAG TPA: VOC family protein [Herpetosiphonaceae bacterium]